MMVMQSKWCVAVALFATVAGCKSKSDGSGDGDGDASSNIEPASGDRLKLRTWSGGGIEWVEGVYDAELGVTCNFTTATDGNRYCFPGYEPNSVGVDVVFTDEDCTEVIGRAWESDCTQVVRYTKLDDVGDCYPAESTLYEVGPEETLPETIYERDRQGNCTPVDATGQGYELTEVPLEDLAPVTSEIVERTTDLGVLMYVSEDGFRLPASAYDLNGDFACYHQQIGSQRDFVDLCVGNLAYTDTSGNYGYADDSCEDIVAGSTQCAEPAYIMSYSQVGECWETELLSVGNEFDKADVHAPSGEDMCAPAGDTYYHAYYEVGGAIETELPLIHVSNEGDTRLVKQTYVHDGTAVFPTTTIWDTSFDTYCYPRVIGDKTYCVPSGTFEMGPEGSWFGDDQCTIQLEYTTLSDCYESSLHMIGTWSEQVSCETTQLDALYSVKLYEEDVIYVIGPEGDCVEEPAQENAIYFTTGDELDPDETLAEVSQSN